MLIQRMRDSTEGIMAKIIIGLICIVFGLFGFGSIGTFLTPVSKVATVNGEDITQQDMEMSVERRRRTLTARGTAFDEDQLREDVLESLVTRTVLSQMAEDLELHFSDGELDAEIVASPAFMLDGQFNGNQFQQVIAGGGFTPMSYRAEIRVDKLFDQMVTGIAQSAFVTSEEAERFQGLLSQRRDIAYLQIPVTDLLEEVIISDGEVIDYYTANLADFVTKEAVNIQYIELDRQSLAAAYEVDELDLKEYFDDNKNSYSIDERRQIAHILIETSENTAYESALAKADATYQRLSTGEEFSNVAREVSDDLGSRESGGDLGLNERGVFAPEFETVAFSLALNEVSEPVETDFGFHIIKILDVEEGYTPDLSEVRNEVEESYRYEATEDEFVSKSSRMAEMLFENFSELEITANSLELEIKSTGQVNRDSEHPLLSLPRVADAAFGPDVLLDGNNSDLLEISDDLHIGLRVVEHLPSKTRSLDEVSSEVVYILKRRGAAELAGSKAREVVGAIEAGSLAQFVADEFGYVWELASGASRFEAEIDPVVLAEAFTLPRPEENKESIGSASFPNGDALVLRVSGVSTAAEKDIQQADLAGINESLAQQSGFNDFDDFQKSLRLESDLERVN